MKLIFDIGYNNGHFSNEMLRLYPASRIIGVEANKSLITPTGYSNVFVINALVSNKDNSTEDFYIEDVQNGISTASKEFMVDSRFGKGNRCVDPSFSHWDRVEKVPTITLDTLVSKYGSPDYIKLDIEGYEYEALSGLSTKQGLISFEWSEEIFHVADKCVAHLINLGYTEFCVSGYFEEGDIFKYLFFDSQADTFELIPNKFYPWTILQEELKTMLHKDRRMNYGMIFARSSF